MPMMKLLMENSLSVHKLHEHKYFNFIPFTYDVTTLDATSTHG